MRIKHETKDAALLNVRILNAEAGRTVAVIVSNTVIEVEDSYLKQRELKRVCEEGY